jgi:hypothetical protein
MEVEDVDEGSEEELCEVLLLLEEELQSVEEELPSV